VQIFFRLLVMERLMVAHPRCLAPGQQQTGSSSMRHGHAAPKLPRGPQFQKAFVTSGSNSTRQRRQSASFTEWRAVPRGDSENPLLVAWKERALGTPTGSLGEPGRAACNVICSAIYTAAGEAPSLMLLGRIGTVLLVGGGN
jgi:hypothetical protein